MADPLQIILLILVLGLTVGTAVVTVRGFGLLKIGWLNFSRLKDLEKQKQDTEDSTRQKALETVIEHCQALRAQWILREPDLEIAKKTQYLEIGRASCRERV